MDRFLPPLSPPLSPRLAPTGLFSIESNRRRKVAVMRNTKTVPYDGYLEDEGEGKASNITIFDIFNIYLCLTVLRMLEMAKGTPDLLTSRLIFNSQSHLDRHGILRSREFSVNIALAYRNRFLRNFQRRSFTCWKLYWLRFTLLRNKMVEYFKFSIMKKRFDAFRLVCRRDMLIRRGVRRFWRKQVALRFRWWKYGARWQQLKIDVKRHVMSVLLEFFESCKKRRRVWCRLVVLCFRRKSILLIQKNIRSLMLRKQFKANKVIKFFFMRCFGIHLIRRRMREEKRRKRYEDETAAIFLLRGQENLMKIIGGKNQYKELMDNYWRSVKGALSRPEEATEKMPVFPSDILLPEISLCWTNKGKAKLILKERCRLDVIELSREKFRIRSPPLYSCDFCGHVSVVRRLAEYHTVYCAEALRIAAGKEPTDIRGCVSWRFAKLVVDVALAPLKPHLR